MAAGSRPSPSDHRHRQLPRGAQPCRHGGERPAARRPGSHREQVPYVPSPIPETTRTSDHDGPCGGAGLFRLADLVGEIRRCNHRAARKRILRELRLDIVRRAVRTARHAARNQGRNCRENQERQLDLHRLLPCQTEFLDCWRCIEAAGFELVQAGGLWTLFGRVCSARTHSVKLFRPRNMLPSNGRYRLVTGCEAGHPSSRDPEGHSKRCWKIKACC